MLSELMQLEQTRNFDIPISGMGGVSTWRDAAEFMLLGASSVQVCTAVMHYGFKIIDELCSGLSNWLDETGAASVQERIGASARRYSPFNALDRSYRGVAAVSAEQCIR